MFCSKCGKELEDGAAFCQFCGQKQTEDSSEKTEKEAGKREEQIGNKQLVLAGVVMAAVILAVIAGFKLVVGDRKEKAAGKIATQETVQEENNSDELTEKMPKEESAEPIGTEEAQEEEENAETEAAAKQEMTEKPYVSHIETGENEYWFDEDGDLVSAKEGAKALDIQYLRDAEGKKIKMPERMLDIFENLGIFEIYGIFCNTKGHLLTSWNWDYGNGGATSETCTHDGENLVEMQIMETGDGGGLETSYQFQYDEGANQIMISEHTLDLRAGDVYEYWNEYICSFEGDKLTEYVIDNSDGLGAHRVREYDASGNLVRDKLEYQTGNDNTEETLYQYDGAGNLLRSEKTTKSEYEGEEVENTVTTDVYQYDEKGNRVKQESETQGTQRGKKYEDHTIIDCQYDESGNKIQEKFNQVSPEYDEAGTVVRQSAYDRNYIWEYDEEGKLTYYSFLSSAAGKDVVANESEYLYDEQGRLSEIQKDGETAMTLNYSDEGMLRQIDLVKELEGTKWIEWNAIEKLFSNGEMAEIDFFSSSWNVLNGDNIVIEYR